MGTVLPEAKPLEKEVVCVEQFPALLLTVRVCTQIRAPPHIQVSVPTPVPVMQRVYRPSKDILFWFGCIRSKQCDRFSLVGYLESSANSFQTTFSKAL